MANSAVQNQVTHVLQTKPQFRMRKGPAPEAAFRADVPDQVVVRHRVVHGHEGVRAIRIGAQVESALRRRGIHTRLPAAGDG